jgi:quercetin dioxygenase-like cupin family protein
MKATHLFDEKKMPLFPGIDAQIFSGDGAMVMRVQIANGAVATPHSHHHEQISILLKGRADFTVGDETARYHAGDVILIPGNVVHTVTALEECELIEVFTPIREDLLARYTTE